VTRMLLRRLKPEMEKKVTKSDLKTKPKQKGWKKGKKTNTPLNIVPAKPHKRIGGKHISKILQGGPMGNEYQPDREKGFSENGKKKREKTQKKNLR